MKATFANILVYAYERLEALYVVEQGLVLYGKNERKRL